MTQESNSCNGVDRGPLRTALTTLSWAPPWTARHDPPQPHALSTLPPEHPESEIATAATPAAPESEDTEAEWPSTD